MLKIFCIILVLMMPLVVWFSVPELPGLFLKSCRNSTITVRHEKDETVITQADWWIDLRSHPRHGLYTGYATFYDADGNRIRNAATDRTFTFSSELKGGYFYNQTTSVSKLTGDDLNKGKLEKYFSPVLVEGHYNLAYLFSLPGGRMLSGLSDRPRVICYP